MVFNIKYAKQESIIRKESMDLMVSDLTFSISFDTEKY